MIPQKLADTNPRLFPVMTEVDTRKAEQVVDDFVARLAVASMPDGERAAVCEAALKRLMSHLIERDGWLAEEFAAAARSLGAY